MSIIVVGVQMADAKFATIRTWEEISGMGRSKTYEELGKGNLRAVKSGRSTLIDVDHGLEYLRSCPRAKITTGLGRNKAANDGQPAA
jgi:hypothetical protein